MRRSLLALCALLMIATSGCDKIKAALSKKKAPAPTPAATNPAVTTPAKPAPGTAAPQQKPAAKPPAPPASSVALKDEPYDSPDTGTVAPGMSERDVYTQWGPPADVRKAGEYTYIYYKNGCEKTCGMLDLVTLQNGQVVDAITRWPGHHYSGQSSSPSPLKPGEKRPTDSTQTSH
ncbi:MAG TPA: hypothetical protein VFK78_01125 [Gemmatimonadales bacterium]|nr:hypothetical protein [Gemmatimonadales bacterium]